ncbi:MAG: hypothetical protein OEZ33_06765, partial [Gammaproteobacteria bacterium]|nr:hypothetical protein [Gammaproteobacteria bacterium]
NTGKKCTEKNMTQSDYIHLKLPVIFVISGTLQYEKSVCYTFIAGRVKNQTGGVNKSTSGKTDYTVSA